MFIIDDILFAPAKGFLWIARELQKAAEQQQTDDRDALMRRLQSLHMKLETGDITEDEFEQIETEILDQLDAMNGESGSDDDADDEHEPDQDDLDDDNLEGDDHAVSESTGHDAETSAPPQTEKDR
ncbi:MAG: gas vesicle protein GvpG [Planctomycetota bacterium]